MATADAPRPIAPRPRHGRPRPKNVERDFLPTLVLLGLSLLLPTTVFYAFNTSSQAPGVAFAAIIAVGLTGLGLTARPSPGRMLNSAALIGAILVGIFAHALVARLFHPLDFTRTLSSLGLLACMAMGAVGLRLSLFELSDTKIAPTITTLFILFLLIGFASVVGFQPPSRGLFPNQVFPFTEPSHYALTLTPILLAFCCISSVRNRIVAILLSIIIAFLLKSLSLVVGVLVVGVICMPIAWIALGGAVLVAVVGAVDTTYFVDRLDLNDNSSNLSVLVYLQGWELAEIGFAKTYGWGLGFQQLGLGPITSYTSRLIVALAGDDANLRDGGFTLAKFIGEFGIFGIALMTAYSSVVIRAALLLRSASIGRQRLPVGCILALSFVCGYSVEAFVRGIGYFSGTTMLTLAAIIYIMDRGILSRRRFLKKSGRSPKEVGNSMAVYMQNGQRTRR